MGVRGRVAQELAPHVPGLAPGLTASFVHEALHRAICGIGPLPGAAAAADKQLREQHGDVDRGVREVIENHVLMAGMQGFVTNLGGLVTMPLTLPANVTGLALLQCREVAGIAHLRGYDIDDPRVRNAILACMLGEDDVKSLVRGKRIPGRPLAIATAPVHDPDLSTVMATEVAGDLIAQVASKKLATRAWRLVPVVGGAVGAGVDAFTTWKVGRYADRELVRRR
jgi:hypothetical protein